jgi:hypothetical protein
VRRNRAQRSPKLIETLSATPGRLRDRQASRRNVSAGELPTRSARFGRLWLRKRPNLAEVAAADNSPCCQQTPTTESSGSEIRDLPRNDTYENLSRNLRILYGPSSKLLNTMQNEPAAISKRQVFHHLLLWISLLSLFGLAGFSTAEAADIQSVPVTSVGPGSRFAIADFDGDLRPDLASIHAEPGSTGTTNYWIELQLSTFGRQSILVIGPPGGLSIAARDANNGNHFIDLALTTAWFNKPVAILINDGHGRFSQVTPTAFPEVFTVSTASWGSSSTQKMEAANCLPQPRPAMYSGASGLSDVRPQQNSISSLTSDFFPVVFVISRAGRAPPSEVTYL